MEGGYIKMGRRVRYVFLWQVDFVRWSFSAAGRREDDVGGCAGAELR